MRKLKPRLTKAETYLLLALLLVGGCYFYLKKVYDPQVQALKKVRQEIVTLQDQNRDMGAVSVSASSLSDTAKRRQQAEALEKSLSDEIAQVKAQTDTDVSQVLDQVNRRVLDSGLVVRKLTFKKIQAQQGESLTWQEYELVLEGLQGSLVGFLGELRGMRRCALLRDMAAKAVEQEDGTGNFSITIDLYI